MDNIIVTKKLQKELDKHNLTLETCPFKNIIYNVFGKTIITINDYSYNKFIKNLEDKK